MAAPDSEYYWGTGRRKTAVARVRLRRGGGRVTVNDRDADEYFVTDRARNAVRGPLRATKSLNRFDILATIKGGGITSQAEAMVLGIARALVKIDATFHETLKDEGYLTRDDRKKERKKYGRRGARAGFQFSKR